MSTGTIKSKYVSLTNQRPRDLALTNQRTVSDAVPDVVNLDAAVGREDLPLARHLLGPLLNAELTNGKRVLGVLTNQMRELPAPRSCG